MKETRIVINTEAGKNSFETEKLKGQIDAIIVDSMERIDIMIESKLGYLVFHRNEHKGIKYYAVRARSEAYERNLLDVPQFEMFNINEELIITVNGQKNCDVAVTLRLI